MSEQTYWNGEPCNALRGTAIVADSPEFPQYWARTEGIIGQRIPVVWISYGDWKYILDNRRGQAWDKVTRGNGSPRYGHADVSIVPNSFKPDDRQRGDRS